MTKNIEAEHSGPLTNEHLEQRIAIVYQLSSSASNLARTRFPRPKRRNHNNLVSLEVALIKTVV